MPPYNHRQNPAERAIQAFKDHFIAILNGVDEGYPPDGWDLLIQQTNMTLNMLQGCSINMAHSSHAYIHGVHDFNAHPLAPLGCKAILHQRSVANGGQRGSWENRGKLGYYIGPALDSYRVWRFYIPSTGGIHETDMAKFLPKYPIPTVTPGDRIAQAIEDIRLTLKHPRPPHTDVTEDRQMGAVIERLKRMYKVSELTYADDVVQGDEITVTELDKNKPDKPKSKEKEPGATRANEYRPNRPKKKQRHPMGTRVQVVEPNHKAYVG